MLLLRSALVAALLSAVLAAGCAARSRDGETVASGARKYPPRRPGCKLTVYPTAPASLVETWDDLGLAQAGCHIDTPRPQCLLQLQAEACRMGANILYDVPAGPLRPSEQALIYRAHAAHTRAPVTAAPAVKAKTKEPDDQLPPPASPEESAGPVMPLTGPGVASTRHEPADGGAAHD